MERVLLPMRFAIAGLLATGSALVALAPPAALGGSGPAVVASIALPTLGSQAGIAANSATNRIYVASDASGSGCDPNCDNVWVIDGSSNAVLASIFLGPSSTPVGIAVNSVTNLIYTANEASNTVSVIDGATNTVTATISGFPSNWGPAGIAVNPRTNRIYVTSNGASRDFAQWMAVIDGATNAILTYIAGSGACCGIPFLAVNSTTNRIYVDWDGPYTCQSLAVVDANTNAVVAVVGGQSGSTLCGPRGIAVNEATNLVYVANQSGLGGTLQVLDGASNALVGSVALSSTRPEGVAFNATSNRIQVADVDGGASIFDASASPPRWLATVPACGSAYGIAATPNVEYVTRVSSPGVSVISDSTTVPTLCGTVTMAPSSDAIPPTTTASLAGTPGQNGWYLSPVTVTLSATDNSGGSGVASTVYGLDGGAAQTYGQAFPVNAGGSHTLTFHSTDVAGNVEASQSVTFKIDQEAPVITCAKPDGQWHAADVSLACTASDAGAGLANAADASFTLSTSVPAGTETSNAMTSSHTVADAAGNTTTAGPIGGNMVDRKPPIITLSAPAGSTYALSQAVAASYSCGDGGAGVATCTGPVPSGSNIDTNSVGTKTFTVTATDAVGNAASPLAVSYQVAYALPAACVLYDQGKAVQSGGVLPVKFQLCDTNGVDVSSSSVSVTAQSVNQISPEAPGTLESVGSANPDNNFRFDPTLGPTGGYIYNLSTKGLAPGTYAIAFTASGDPTTHQVQFQVK